MKKTNNPFYKRIGGKKKNRISSLIFLFFSCFPLILFFFSFFFPFQLKTEIAPPLFYFADTPYEQLDNFESYFERFEKVLSTSRFSHEVKGTYFIFNREKGLFSIKVHVRRFSEGLHSFLDKISEIKFIELNTPVVFNNFQKTAFHRVVSFAGFILLITAIFELFIVGWKKNLKIIFYLFYFQIFWLTLVRISIIPFSFSIIYFGLFFSLFPLLSSFWIDRIILAKNPTLLSPKSWLQTFRQLSPLARIGYLFFIFSGFLILKIYFFLFFLTFLWSTFFFSVLINSLFE